MSTVILIDPKYLHNVAAAIRACSCFGIDTLYWTGSRINSREYGRLPREERMKGYKDVTWKNVEKPFNLLPDKYKIVCVELTNGAWNIDHTSPVQDAAYVFGPEDGGVPQTVKRLCHEFVFIPSYHCLNLSAAINVVLYDRFKKLNPGIWNATSVLKETRGEIAMPGWDGK